MISLRFLCSASPYVPSKMFVYRVQPCVRKERLLEVEAEEDDDGDGYDGVVVLRFFFVIVVGNVLRAQQQQLTIDTSRKILLLPNPV
jgi:hypothetical protein